MSASLIAVVLALFLGHAFPGLGSWRRFGWFERWQQAVLGNSSLAPLWTLLPPVLLVLGLQLFLRAHFFGLIHFLFSVFILVYCWGPRDLDRDPDAIAEARDATEEQRAVATLLQDHAPDTDAANLPGQVFEVALRRWFSGLLWFLLLGPTGALLYRLTERATHKHPADPEHSSRGWQAHVRLRRLLEWPAAQLMVLALAIGHNFDTVLTSWRGWHASRRGQGFDLSSQFLRQVGAACVRQSQHEQMPANTEEISALRISQRLIWRILLAWIVVISLFVLSGHV